jgi:hypothetical protein
MTNQGVDGENLHCVPLLGGLGSGQASTAVSGERGATVARYGHWKTFVVGNFL